MVEHKYSPVFISHATEDEGLAKAWRFLIRGITDDEIKPWYSSYILAGDDWRNSLSEALEHAQVILAIITPGSNERPWVHYEVGFAKGQNKKIIPVLHFIEKDNVNDLFKSMTPQAIMGRNKEEVFKMLQDVILNGKKPSDVQLFSWEHLFEKYYTMLVQEGIASITRTHFQSHFHKESIARGMKGTWTAQWTQIHDDGKKETFEKDTLYIWTTRMRIRMVGRNQKKGMEQFSKPEYQYYPMEGVVSSGGWITMSYWSAGDIPICGTCLLQRKGASGRHLEGSWEGFTAKHIDEDPKYVRGRVVMAKLDDSILTPEALSKLLNIPNTYETTIDQ